MLSEPSELSKLSELIELPEDFSSMKKCLFCGALRPGDPLIKLLELRFVSLSSESSITSHPAFPDVGEKHSAQRHGSNLSTLDSGTHRFEKLEGHHAMSLQDKWSRYGQ